MDELDFFEIDSKYIEYLSGFEPHLFHNKKITQNFSRKYVGIILKINGFDYFAPLSSFKEKHKKLSETLDFIKLGNYAVINLNNMFPAPKTLYNHITINAEKDVYYRKLLQEEFRILKQKSEMIVKNAQKVYEHKLTNDGKSKLSQRCNDFKLLEEKCVQYKL